MRCGGFRPVEKVTLEHQEIVDRFKDVITEQLKTNGRNGSPQYFKVLEVQHQVVAGLNYLFKIQLQENGTECVFVKIYKSLQDEFTLSGLIEEKQVDDPLEMI